MRSSVATHWDRLELAGRGELLYATGVPLPLRHQPAGQDLRQLSSPRHGIDLSLRCSQGLVSAELVIDLGAGADLAGAVDDEQHVFPYVCEYNLLEPLALAL